MLNDDYRPLCLEVRGFLFFKKRIIIYFAILVKYFNYNSPFKHFLVYSSVALRTFTLLCNYSSYNPSTELFFYFTIISIPSSPALNYSSVCINMTTLSPAVVVSLRWLSSLSTLSSSLTDAVACQDVLPA